MKRLFGVLVLASLFLGISAWAHAQETGYWQAASTSAKKITGDVSFSSEKISIDYHTFWIAQIRTLTPAEISAAFGVAFNESGANTAGSGNLYRVSIPADRRMLHKNTLCGSDDTQWIATYSTGRTLQLAFFSTSHMPVLTSSALASSSNLCGVFSYAR